MWLTRNHHFRHISLIRSQTHLQFRRGSSGPNFVQLLREEGFKRLWRGAPALMMAVVPAHAAYFSAYEVGKQSFGANQSGHHPIAAAGAGAMATLLHDAVMTPMDVVKQRLQLGYYTGMLHCMRSMIAHEGVAGLYRSYPTTVIMNLPYAGVVVASNESLKKLLSPALAQGTGQPSMGVVLAAGAGAGAIAAAATCPLDVIKTRIQTESLMYLPPARSGLSSASAAPPFVSDSASARHSSGSISNSISSICSSGTISSSGWLSAERRTDPAAASLAFGHDKLEQHHPLQPSRISGSIPPVSAPASSTPPAPPHSSSLVEPLNNPLLSRGGSNTAPRVIAASAAASSPASFLRGSLSQQVAMLCTNSTAHSQQQSQQQPISEPSASSGGTSNRRIPRSAWDLARAILRDEGPRAFFKGAGARMMVHTPSMAISWGTYEFIKAQLGGREQGLQ